MSLLENCHLMTQQSPQFDFGPIAGRYDSWYDSPVGSAYDRLEKQAMDYLLADIPKNRRLLEVGCGTGHWSRYFSDMGFTVTGIDLSNDMLEIARQKRIPNTRFEIADAGNLPFADDTFDIVAAIAVLEFTAEPSRVVAEMVRCAKKKNGIILVGALNALNKDNRRRKDNPDSVFSSAHLFTPRQITDLLRPYGILSTRTAGFIPKNERLLRMAPVYEHLGRLLRPERAAFIAVRVDL